MRSLLVVLFVLAFWFVGKAQIINFQDANFKNALVNTKCVDTDGDFAPDSDIDLNNDGEIEAQEALAISNLSIPSQSISNLEDIHYFSNLTELNCSDNNLVSLNLSKNNKLSVLYCGSNHLDSLLLDSLTNLSLLSCTHNHLKNLDVSMLYSLYYLGCENNEIEELKFGEANKYGLIEVRCG